MLELSQGEPDIKKLWQKAADSARVTGRGRMPSETADREAVLGTILRAYNYHKLVK